MQYEKGDNCHIVMTCRLSVPTKDTDLSFEVLYHNNKDMFLDAITL